MSSSSRSRRSISKHRGRGDVLQVDAAVAGGDAADDLDDQIGVLGVQHHRPGVDAAELLEQRGLSLHHRHRRGRADVAQPEDGGPVGDDRDGVPLDRQPAGVGRVLRDRHADPGNTRGVGAGQVVPVFERHLGHHLDLAAEMQQERPITDLAHTHAGQVLDGLGDLVGVRRIDRIAGHVDHDVVGPGFDDVQRGE